MVNKNNVYNTDKYHKIINENELTNLENVVIIMTGKERHCSGRLELVCSTCLVVYRKDKTDIIGSLTNTMFLPKPNDIFVFFKFEQKKVDEIHLNRWRFTYISTYVCVFLLCIFLY